VSFLLDTNILSAFLRGNGRVQSKFLQHGGQLYTSTLNIGELLIWAYKSSKRMEREAAIQQMLADVVCLPIAISTAEVFAEVRTQQFQTGQMTPALDLFISCVALEHNFTLITDNESDFVGILNLRVANWLT
jgi:predicted nucleic acid-binding protein